MSSQRTSTMLQAALSLAARGFRVHPLYEPNDGAPVGVNAKGEPTGGCSCQQPECDSAGKHPRLASWPTAATSDVGQIRHWWRTWPSANIGIVTGTELPGGSYLAVVDLDPRNDGDSSLADLEAEHGALPEGARVVTGGGGWHFYFTTPEPVRSCDLAPGLELKARGKYVVAPPSLHPSGRRYEWAR